MGFQQLLLVFSVTSLAASEVLPSLNFDYPYITDDVYDQPVNLMTPKKLPHEKTSQTETTERPVSSDDDWPAFDFSKFENYLNNGKEGPEPEHNRVKRRAKRRRGRGDRRRNRQRATTAPPEYEPCPCDNSTNSSETPEQDESKNATSTEVPVARQGSPGSHWETQQIGRKRKNRKDKNQPLYDTYDTPLKEWENNFVEMPKDLYQAHLRPGVIFRIHMSEAILKMQYRNYGEDKDESVIEADVEYLRLTRKVINDEITKFEDLKWLISWFNNRSELIQEHMCNTRYYAVGTPPTMFTHPEEYMKRLCLFDSVYIDHIPYVVGEDSSLLAAVAPPVLHCDAATCTSVPFIDSVMFDERLARTNVRTLTRCQASCRAHCRNDPDCLKRCSDRCLRSD